MPRNREGPAKISCREFQEGKGAAKDLESSGLPGRKVRVGGGMACFRESDSKKQALPLHSFGSSESPTGNRGRGPGPDAPPSWGGREEVDARARASSSPRSYLGGSANPARRVQKTFTVDPGSSFFPGPETNGGRKLPRISDS